MGLINYSNDVVLAEIIVNEFLKTTSLPEIKLTSFCKKLVDGITPNPTSNAELYYRILSSKLLFDTGIDLSKLTPQQISECDLIKQPSDYYKKLHKLILRGTISVDDFTSAIFNSNCIIRNLRRYTDHRILISINSIVNQTFDNQNTEDEVISIQYEDINGSAVPIFVADESPFVLENPIIFIIAENLTSYNLEHESINQV